MTGPERTARLRALAGSLERIDREVYATYGRDPTEPIIGGGPEDARVAILGRDPGRHEVEHGTPFIGKGGQAVRGVLHERFLGGAPDSLEASRRAGRFVFWTNTVPYKPIGNKAWNRATLLAFRPVMADLLVTGWRGRDVLALGQQAFLWFGLADKDTHRRLVEHWARPDRFEQSIEVEIHAPAGERATFRVHPLPHPSPLNATWHRRFPGLLAARLDALGVARGDWRVGGGGGEPADV